MKNDDLILLIAAAGIVLGVGLYLRSRTGAVGTAAGPGAGMIPSPGGPISIPADSLSLYQDALGLDMIGRFGNTGGPDADTDAFGNPLNARGRR